MKISKIDILSHLKGNIKTIATIHNKEIWNEEKNVSLNVIFLSFLHKLWLSDSIFIKRLPKSISNFFYKLKAYNQKLIWDLKFKFLVLHIYVTHKHSIIILQKISQIFYVHQTNKTSRLTFNYFLNLYRIDFWGNNS